jgi:hypothetical protein
MLFLKIEGNLSNHKWKDLSVTKWTITEKLEKTIQKYNAYIHIEHIMFYNNNKHIRNIMIYVEYLFLFSLCSSSYGLFMLKFVEYSYGHALYYPITLNIYFV